MLGLCSFCLQAGWETLKLTPSDLNQMEVGSDELYEDLKYTEWGGFVEFFNGEDSDRDKTITGMPNKLYCFSLELDASHYSEIYAAQRAPSFLIKFLPSKDLMSSFPVYGVFCNSNQMYMDSLPNGFVFSARGYWSRDFSLDFDASYYTYQPGPDILLLHDNAGGIGEKQFFQIRFTSNSKGGMSGKRVPDIKGLPFTEVYLSDSGKLKSLGCNASHLSVAVKWKKDDVYITSYISLEPCQRKIHIAQLPVPDKSADLAIITQRSSSEKLLAGVRVSNGVALALVSLCLSSAEWLGICPLNTVLENTMKNMQDAFFMMFDKKNCYAFTVDSSGLVCKARKKISKTTPITDTPVLVPQDTSVLG